MNTIARVFTVLLAAVLLAGCGGKSGGREIPVEEMAAAVNEALGKGDALMKSDGAFLSLTGTDADKLGEHSVYINRYGANIDEYGIFRADKDGMSAKALKELAQTYLDVRMKAWMDEYMPEEKPKLEDAEVRVSGDYVMYCILSEADKTAAFKILEAAR